MLTTNVKRRDFTLIFDVKNGNPNGDPDSENDPRMDPDSGIGLVTAECTKRKIRNAALLHHEGEPGYEMFVERGAVLNRKIRDAYEEAGVVISEGGKAKKGKKPVGDESTTKTEDKDSRVGREQAEKGNKRFTERYFDARWFGGVVTGVGSGRITGPIQVGIAESVLPISDTLRSMAGTRCATTSEKQSDKQDGLNQNWVRRNIIPYALYTQSGHLNPFQARNTGFVEEDWSNFLAAVKGAYENDRSSGRGLMTLRQVVIFEHSDPLGNARAADLFSLVRVTSRDEDKIPFSFEGYRIDIDRARLPCGVVLHTMYPEVAHEVAAE